MCAKIVGGRMLWVNEFMLQVIMATNKIESLDPALIRPGRIDRKIEFPLPDTKTKRRIFGIHTGRMTLAEDVNLEEFIMAKVWIKQIAFPNPSPNTPLAFTDFPFFCNPKGRYPVLWAHSTMH